MWRDQTRAVEGLAAFTWGEFGYVDVIVKKAGVGGVSASVRI